MIKKYLLLVILIYINYFGFSQEIPEASAISSIEILTKKSGENILGYKYLIRNEEKSFSIYQISSFYLPVQGEKEFELFKKMDTYFRNDPLDFATKLSRTFFDEFIQASQYSKDQIRYYYKSRVSGGSEIYNQNDTILLGQLNKNKIQSFLNELEQSYTVDSLSDLLKLAEITPEGVKSNLTRYLNSNEQKCLNKVAKQQNLLFIAKQLFVENPFYTSIENTIIEIVLITKEDKKIRLTIQTNSNIYLPIIIDNSLKSYNIHLIDKLSDFLPESEVINHYEIGTENFRNQFFRNAKKIYCN